MPQWHFFHMIVDTLRQCLVLSAVAAMIYHGCFPLPSDLAGNAARADSADRDVAVEQQHGGGRRLPVSGCPSAGGGSASMCRPDCVAKPWATKLEPC